MLLYTERLNSCYTDVLLMLHGKTDGNQQIVRVCRIVLVIFSHIYLFVSVKMNYFIAGVFSVFFTNTKIIQKICESTAKNKLSR